MCQTPILDVSKPAETRAEAKTEAIEDYAKAIYAISRERDGLVLNG